MLCGVLVEQARHGHMSDEYKKPIYINYSIAEARILVLHTMRDHHNGSPPELTKVEKVKRINNNLPTCTVDRLLKLSCILLVRIFHIHISKLQSTPAPLLVSTKNGQMM